MKDLSKGHLKLDVWRKSIDFVTILYKTTSGFPNNESYGIVSQLRRAGVSISANIAEGAARSGKREFIHFLSISLGSLSEVETLLIISERCGYINSDQSEEIDNQLSEIRRMLIGLTKFLQKT